MPAITVSATYGADGSEISQQVAQLIGWPLLDRLIPVQVATELQVPVEEAEARDEVLVGGLIGWLSRVGPLPPSWGESADVPEVSIRDEFLVSTERVIKDAATNGAVILGRAAALVLSGRAHVLHVRLDGPREARARAAATHFGISADAARQQLEATDRMRERYWRYFYGRRWNDPNLYHITLDSTTLLRSHCVDLIIMAAELHLARGRA
jgi:hypothetical protein